MWNTLVQIPGWGWVLGSVIFWLGFVQHKQQKHWEKYAQRLNDDIDELVDWVREIDPNMEDERRLLGELDKLEEEDFQKGRDEPGTFTLLLDWNT